MAVMVDESVGTEFSVDAIKTARDLTLAVISEAAQNIKPGDSESYARELVKQIQQRLGAPKSWHPPQIRFGENTLLPFGVKGSDDIVLKENDIFFIDIGPIFNGHEGDVGRAFAVGQDLEMQKCCKDVAEIWFEVRNYWFEKNVSGSELYKFAKTCAENRGWILSLKEANGHRIADFPHSAKARGSIEGFENTPSANRWILEIQIRHPRRPFGAFYEDLLN